MTNTTDLAPENHNSEQDDKVSQAQTVADDAEVEANHKAGGTESRKPASPSVDNIGGNETDLIDQMRKMEETGEIDEGAFAGEPQHDDKVPEDDS
ncbi:MAG: hypothetical protein SXU28_04055 [Pseudomonadota bacterium]|nr:hypothetical protein [Pseudomonadota bacterium]